MRQYFVSFIIVFFAVLGISNLDVQAEEPVIKHPNLEEAIKFQLDIDSKVTISKEKLQNLSSLDASWWGVGSLEGIEQANNLKALYLDGNGLQDVSALYNLTQLQHLILTDNQISDLSFLTNYKNLHVLDVASNQLKSVEPLSKVQFTGSEGGLSLAHNQLLDLSPLLTATYPNNPKYFYLDVSNNRLGDLHGLENVKGLTELSAQKNNLANLDALSTLENIHYLDINDNEVNSLQSIAGNKLETLKAANNNLPSLDGLQVESDSSYYFELQNNNLKDIDNLQNITKGYINLENNQITNIAALKDMSKGTVLLKGNPLESAAMDVIYTLEKRGVEVTYDPIEITGLDKYRLAGASRYHTAVKVSQAGWDKSDTVILARGDSFPDALAGVPLAGSLDAPILLTPQEKLSGVTKEEIDRLGATKVIILGGTGAVSDNVLADLPKKVNDVERIAGSGRFDTAKKIAEKMGGSPSTAIVAYGYNFPDALAAASYAAQKGYPILLTDKDKLPSVTEKYLKRIPKKTIVGGESVVSKGIQTELQATRIGGKSRFETAIKMITELGMNTDTVFIGNGYGFADNLTGSVLAAKNSAPLLLVEENEVPSEIKDIFMNYPISNFTALGGKVVISDEVIFRLKKLQE
jgi:putative cell wall-binding protein